MINSNNANRLARLGRRVVRRTFTNTTVAKQSETKYHNATGKWDAFKAQRKVDADELHVRSIVIIIIVCIGFVFFLYCFTIVICMDAKPPHTMYFYFFLFFLIFILLFFIIFFWC